MKILKFIFLISIFFALNCKDKYIPYTKGDIFEIFTFSNEFKGVKTYDGMYLYKLRTFIIKNFHDYNDSLIQSFVEEKYAEIDTLYSKIIIIFYKESKYTNVKNLEKNPRDLDRYSQKNDIVYLFERGAFWNSKITRIKYKGTEIIK